MRGFSLFLLLLLAPAAALADVDTIKVNYLPLAEAEAAVRTQLSGQGSVASMPSRNLLIINDDAVHLRNARSLLKRLDVAAPQYSLTLEMIRVDNASQHGVRSSAALPNGWVRIALDERHQHSSGRQQFTLHVSAGKPGMIEAGRLQPYRQRVRQWLAGYGVIDSSSVELVSVTSGFSATVSPVGDDRVNVRIDPWMRNLRGDRAVHGDTEILIDLGSTHAPKHPPQADAPVRLNAVPESRRKEVIEMAGASTEFTVPIGESVLIMAGDKEAALLGQALLSGSSGVNENRLAIRVTVEAR